MDCTILSVSASFSTGSEITVQHPIHRTEPLSVGLLPRTKSSEEFCQKDALPLQGVPLVRAFRRILHALSTSSCSLCTPQSQCPVCFFRSVNWTCLGHVVLSLTNYSHASCDQSIKLSLWIPHSHLPYCVRTPKRINAAIYFLLLCLGSNMDSHMHFYDSVILLRRLRRAMIPMHHITTTCGILIPSQLIALSVHRYTRVV